MKYWSDFLEEVVPYMDNCPTIIAENAIRNAAIEFCQRTAVWKKEVDAITIHNNENIYDFHFEISEGESISAIDYAFIYEDNKNLPLYVTSEDEMKNKIPQWRTVSSPTPTLIMMTDTVNIRVYPTPDRTILNSLIVGLIIKPSRAADYLPDWIHEQWAEAIAFGAKSRLFNMKMKPWFDGEASLDDMHSFEKAIKDATIRTNKGHSRKNLTVQTRKFL